MDLYERNQSQERLKKIKKVYEFFDSNGGNIKEISKKLDIPESTIQRYLHSNDFIEYAKTAAEEDKKTEPKELENKKGANITQNLLDNYLNEMKKEGTIKGGKNSQEKFGYEKNENGKFQGSRKK